MNVIHGFNAASGTRFKMKVTSVDPAKDVATFGAVLKRFDHDGGGIDKSWSGPQLLAGVQAVFGDAHGYDIIVIPISKPGSDPHIKVSLDASDVGFTDDADEAVGDNEPFGWRVLMQ